MSLNPAFLANRAAFDLAVVHNGSLDAEAESYFRSIPADHFIVRDNLGNEGGAFDKAIRTLPAYDWYLFVHDDHWLWDANWHEPMAGLLENRTDTCFGNLVDMTFEWSDACNRLVEPWNLHFEQTWLRFAMLQGMAGFHPRAAIEAFLRRGGIPFADYAQESCKDLTHFYELVFSLILVRERLKFEPLPGGFEFMLLHSVHALNPENATVLQRLPAPVQAHLRELKTQLSR